MNSELCVCVCVCVCVRERERENTEMAFSFDRCTFGGFLNWRYDARIENYV